MQPVVKLVILGRDGILNDFRDDHVKAPDEWFPVPGALEAVSRMNHAGWHVVVATNQSGIGRGMIDMASVNAVHAHLNKQLMAVGGRIDAVFFCPHTPEDQCDCRKPLPGLMRDIGKRFGTDLKHVPMVGDTLRDLQAAHAAGCEPHLIRSGRAALLGPELLQSMVDEVPGTRVHADLAEFAEYLLARGVQPAPSRPPAADAATGAAVAAVAAVAAEVAVATQTATASASASGAATGAAP